MRREPDDILDTPLAQAADWMAVRRSGAPMSSWVSNSPTTGER